MWIENKEIRGQFVTLEPINLTHLTQLMDAVKDGESWKLWFANVPRPEQMQDYIQTAIEGAQNGNIAYAVRNNKTNNIVGTTRYYKVDEANRRVMIGYTWYANSVRRTPVNTECKLLLLREIFESYDAIAVEFRTHSENTASRNAIERLGAKFDGVLRNHQILKDGSLRDTAVYSIVADEWDSVKENLCNNLNRTS